MKKAILLCIALVFILLLSACGSPCEVHKFKDWVIQTPVTCTTDGMQNRVCKRCRIVEEDIIPMIGHDFGEWNTIAEATCEEDGTQRRICSLCNAVEEESLLKLDHNYADWEVETEATCAEWGTQVRRCTRCPKTVSKPLSMLGHTYGEWEEVLSPTCVDKGQKSRVCLACDFVGTSTIPPLKHEYEDCVCTRCGEKQFDLCDKGVFYEIPDGLSVKLTGFTKIEKEGYYLYRITYTEKNNQPDTAITQGRFRLYLSDGTVEGHYGFYGQLYYKDSYNFIYEWKVLKTKEALYLEYVPSNDSKPTAEEFLHWLAP